MDERWRILTRVRDIRTRVALYAVMRERRAQARAQATLQQALQRQAELEEQATWAAGLLAERSGATGEAVYAARQAQELLDFVATVRVKAREAAAPVRRAQLQYAHTQEGVAELSAKYWHEAGRKQAVESRWRAELRAGRRLQEEREDEAGVEERTGSHIARRLREADGYGDPE